MTNSRHTKPTDKKRVWRIILIILLVLVLLFAAATGTFFLLAHYGKRSLTEEKDVIAVPSELLDDYDDDGTHVTYKGVKYAKNENIVNILVLGVDKEKISKNLGAGKNGQADSIFAAALDTVTGKVSMIPISRECMTNIKTYSADGTYVGTEKTQLCLAYAYGNNGEESCKNTADAVQNLLYGIKIDAYVAMDTNGLAALTNALGGVRLTTLESVAYGNEYIPGNTDVILKGEKAIAYIRSRTDEVDANTKRVARQKQFLNMLFSTGKEKIRQNPASIPRYYNVVKPYIISDLDLSEITYLAKSTLTAPDISINYLDVAGETRMGEEHSEFYPNEVSLYEAVLNAYYVVEE